MAENGNRLSTGIEGLDNLLGGGIPEGHIVAVVGSFGTGKTILALQFIYEGLKNGESTIFISFDEDEDSILKNAMSIGMDLTSFGELFQIVRLDASEVRKSIKRLESDVLGIIERSGTRRIVIDSISVLEMLFDYTEIHRMHTSLRNILKKSRITSIITSESDKTNNGYSKYGIIEYVCDGSIFLKIIRNVEFEEPTMGLEVIKMRRIEHPRKTKPFVISDRGIVVFEEAEIF